jgi:hypothetical protein
MEQPTWIIEDMMVIEAEYIRVEKELNARE